MVTPTANDGPQLPPRLLRDTRWTLILLGATLLTSVLGVPMVLLAIVTGPAAAGFAISGLVRSRGLTGVLVLRMWMWFAVGIGALSTITAAGALILREPLAQLSDCNARAITETAKRQCVIDYEQAYRDLLARYGVTTRP